MVTETPEGGRDAEVGEGECESGRVSQQRQRHAADIGQAIVQSVSDGEGGRSLSSLPELPSEQA